MIVVTGAAGYVGGRLVGHLTGAAVRPLGRDDLTADRLPTAVQGATAVVHLAGANEVEAVSDPDGAMSRTVTTTRQVAAAAAAAGVERIVYVSTIHVYGAAMTEDAVVREDTVPAPRHPYATARLASEHIAATEAGADRLVVLRLTNAVGPPATPTVARWTLLVNDLCRQAATDKRLVLKSAGDQWRDFVAMDDAVRAIAAATDPAALPSGTYNLGRGVSHTVMEVAVQVQDAFEALTGARPPIEHPPATGPAPRPYRVDVGRLAAHGLVPASDLSGAIRDTAAFCLENRERL